MEQVSEGVEFTSQAEGLPLSTGSANSTSKRREGWGWTQITSEGCVAKEGIGSHGAPSGTKSL